LLVSPRRLPPTSSLSPYTTLFRSDLLIPLTDQVILPLSRERARFEGICKLALPDADALQVVTDKSETIRLAERLGVPVPRTRLRSEEHTSELQSRVDLVCRLLLDK